MVAIGASAGFERQGLIKTESVKVDVEKGKVGGQNALDQLADALGIKGGEGGATVTQTLTGPGGQKLTLNDKQVQALEKLFGGTPGITDNKGNSKDDFALIKAFMTGHLSENELKDAVAVAKGNEGLASHNYQYVGRSVH